MKLDNLAMLKKLTSFAIKNNIQKLKLDGIEIELNSKAFISKKQQKIFENLVNPSKSESEDLYRNDLFYSA